MSEAKALKLIVEDATGQRTVVPVVLDPQGDLTIGRSPEAALRLNERNVSRKHAKLHLMENLWQVHDLGSYNGVLLNGTRIEGQHPVAVGDSIRIGDFQLELRLADSMGHEITKPTLLIGNDEGTEPEGEGFARARQLAFETTAPGDFAVPTDAPRAKAAVDVGAPGGVAAARPAVLELLAEEATEVLPQNDNAHHAVQLPPPHAHWLCLLGEHAGRSWPIDRAAMVLGRTPDNDIVIDHRSMSRHHARVLVKDGRYRIVDLDSANGLLVNDEAYTETELKHNDIAELGHVKLRFVAPSEAAVLTQEEREQVQAQRRPQAVSKKSQRLPYVAMAALLCSIIASYAYLSRAPEASTTAATFAIDPESAHSEEEHLLVQARQAISVRNYPRAESLASAVLELEPKRDEARQILALCDVEKKGRDALEQATSAVGREDWAQAYEALLACPKTSSSSSRAATLMDRVRPNLVAARVALVKRALQADHIDEADRELTLLEAMAQVNVGAVELRMAVDEGRRAHARSAAEGNASLAAAGAGKGHPSSSDSRRDNSSRSGRVPADDAQKLYSDGSKLLNAGHNDKAIDALLRCVSLDKNYGRCYRALGIAYAKTGNAPKAVRYYRQYLKADPQAKDAASVKLLLQQYESSQERSTAADGNAP